MTDKQESKLSHDLLVSALAQIQVHSIYSIYKYYGTLNIPPLESLPVLKQIATGMGTKVVFQDSELSRWRQVSNVAGVVAEMIVYAWVFTYADFVTTDLVSVALGLLHFYAMEIDYKYVLQVRPYAMLPFPLGAVAFAYLAYLATME